MTIKNTGKHKVNFYLDVSQISELKKLSQKLCVSMGSLLRLAVGEFIKKNKDK